MQTIIRGFEMVLVVILISLSLMTFNQINQLGQVGSYEDIRLKYHVAVLTDESISYDQAQFLDGIRAASELYEISVEHYFITEENADDQFNMIKHTHIDGIILKLANHARVEEHVKGLKEKGVFVVLAGNDAPETERDIYLGSNKYLQGKEAAHLAVEAIGGDGEIALILGSEYSGTESASLKHFISGIYDTLSTYDSHHISGVYHSKEKRAEIIIDELLNQPLPVKAIICTDLVDVSRVIRVLVDRNAVGDITIIGSGNSTEIEDYIQKKIIYATIVEEHYETGELAMTYLYKLFQGELGPNYVNVSFEIIK